MELLCYLDICLQSKGQESKFLRRSGACLVLPIQTPPFVCPFFLLNLCFLPSPLNFCCPLYPTSLLVISPIHHV